MCKEVAKFARVAKWEECTRQALLVISITQCIVSKLTYVDVAAKVRHTSINSQKCHLTDCNKRKVNQIFAMTNKPEDRSMKPFVAKEIVAEDAVIAKTQPMLPHNCFKFFHVPKKHHAGEPKEDKEKRTLL